MDEKRAPQYNGKKCGKTKENGILARNDHWLLNGETRHKGHKSVPHDPFVVELEHVNPYYVYKQAGKHVSHDDVLVHVKTIFSFLLPFEKSKEKLFPTSRWTSREPKVQGIFSSSPPQWDNKLFSSSFLINHSMNISLSHTYQVCATCFWPFSFRLLLLNIPVEHVDISFLFFFAFNHEKVEEKNAKNVKWREITTDECHRRFSVFPFHEGMKIDFHRSSSMILNEKISLCYTNTHIDTCVHGRWITGVGRLSWCYRSRIFHFHFTPSFLLEAE